VRVLVASIGCLLIATMGIAEQNDRTSEELIDTVARGEREDRRTASNALVRRYTNTVWKLVANVNAPVNRPEYWSDESSGRNISMAILGEMRARDAVPALIKWLIPREGQIVTNPGVRGLSPAGKALVKIGKPSVGPLIEVLAADTEERKWISGYRNDLTTEISIILRKIEGVRGASFVLQEAIDGESDAKRRSNLEAALEKLN